MNIDSLGVILPSADFTILSFGNDLPSAAATLAKHGEAKVFRAGTTTEAARLITSTSFDVVVIEEKGNWNEAKEVIGLASRKGDSSIIVEGRARSEVGRLRALLAGADAYVPEGKGELPIKRVPFPPEKPIDLIVRRLTTSLEQFDLDLPTKILEQITDRCESLGAGAHLSDVVRLAAHDVRGDFSPAIINATISSIRLSLRDAMMDHIEIGGVATERSRHLPDDVPPPAGEEHQESDGGRPSIYWNLRFPDHPGVLATKPHQVEVGVTYPIETAIESAPGTKDLAQAIPAERLLGKKVSFTLTAVNGKFRPEGETGVWRSAIVSEAMVCTEDGTKAFRADYRPTDSGPGEIEAMVLVNGGSIARNVVDLTIVEPEGPPQGRSSAQSVAVALPEASLAEPAGADLLLHMTSETALLKMPTLTIQAEWQGEQAIRAVTRSADEAYRNLAALTARFRPVDGLGLLGGDGGRVLVELARIGSKLHGTLFSKWGAQNVPPALRNVADTVRAMGSTTSPPQLQVIATKYPIPWGVIYDGELPPRNTTEADVKPDRFWGMRFDIYRHVNPPSLGLGPLRGTQCVVKPIVGRGVPRGKEQLTFVEGLATRAIDGLKVRKIARTGGQLLRWAESKAAIDLVYFYCHARPEDKTMIFGPTDDDKDRVSLGELARCCEGPRLRNPVVIMNACSSGQNDAIDGAPFVAFFTEKWGAQAFIGTDWPVQASMANQVGIRLLEEIITHRHSLRTALRAVVSAGAAEQNFFPLMYAIYGPSNVKFAVG